MSNTPENSDVTVLDARDLECPLPLLKAKLALNKLDGGALLRVLATDAGSQRDFAVFSEQAGHELIESTETDGEYHYLLRKAS